MEAINELELREVLKRRLTPQELLSRVIKGIMNVHLSWEEKRPYFAYLFLTGRHATLMHVMKQMAETKSRIPFDLLIALTGEAYIQPKLIVLESTVKGLKKQSASEDLFASRQWDKWDPRFAQMRNELVETKVRSKNEFKENFGRKILVSEKPADD
ncbi:MAG: hypothetical protein HC883_04255 [Bdellovibrionaceae bacterium]|nr:hypothetical protein [Pseudobdellovibrionaceae bacterium]